MRELHQKGDGHLFKRGIFAVHCSGGGLTTPAQKKWGYQKGARPLFSFQGDIWFQKKVLESMPFWGRIWVCGLSRKSLWRMVIPEIGDDSRTPRKGVCGKVLESMWAAAQSC